MTSPAFEDRPPDSPHLTSYDETHLVTYLRLLDADEEGADWREAVRIIFGLDPERDPSAPRLAIKPLVCSLAGQNHPVTLAAGSKAAGLYGVTSTIEPFFCSYGLNPDYLPMIEARGLCVGGVGEDGTVRILELAGHPFFFATLFVPQAHSTPEQPHPLITALVMATRAYAAKNDLRSHSLP